MIKKILTYAGTIVLSLAAGGIGSLATTANIPTWYAGLDKPPLNPPNWLFGPVWSLLYILMGIALALVITQVTSKSKKQAYWWFAVQLTLNTAWSLVFFGLHAPWAGVAVIATLLISIVLTIRQFKAINQLAAGLLIPYILWVGFATYLTAAIATLNT